jgi:hypothetical protein
MYRFGVVSMLAGTMTTSGKALSELKIIQNCTKNSIGQTKLEIFLLWILKKKI